MNFLKSQGSFLLVYCVFLLVALGLFARFEQKELHMLFNGFHNEGLDTFFYYATLMGDGRLLYLIPLLLFITTYRKVIYVFSACALSGLFTQALKRIIAAPRPAGVFELSELHLVEGINVHKFFSFPSGHSTTVFAFFFALSVLKPKYAFVFVLLALAGGYSRVYLSQHFLEDVVAGSLIGISGALLTLLLVKRIKSSKLDQTLFGFADKL